MLCILTPWWPCQNATISSQGTTPAITSWEQWGLALAHWIKGGWLGNLALVRGTFPHNSYTNTHTVDSSRRLILPFADDGNAVSSGANGWANVCHLMTQEPQFLQEQHNTNRVRHLEATVFSKQHENLTIKIFEAGYFAKSNQQMVQDRRRKIG